MSYWVYTALRNCGEDVVILEDLTYQTWRHVARFQGGVYLIDLTDYGQIDLATQIYRELRVEGRAVFVFGYAPLIRHLRLPLWEPTVDILSGVFSWPLLSHEFRFAKGCDCDSHVKTPDPRPMIPVYLSIGCRGKCPYCYVPVSNYPFGVASKQEREAVFGYVVSRGLDVHFMDEDFFAHPELDDVLSSLHGRGVRWICLTTSISLARALEKYGEKYLFDCGLSLAEIGLEVSDSWTLGKAQNLGPVLASGVDVLWLLMTFLPHDTILQHNVLGDFLREHGQPPERMLPRLRTNSTVAGLGQFFQAYHGTKGFESLRDGVTFTSRSLRLWPSWVGNVFLDCQFRMTRELVESDWVWFDMYNPRDVVAEVAAELRLCSIREAVVAHGAGAAVVAAQMARLRIIEAKP